MLTLQHRNIQSLRSSSCHGGHCEHEQTPSRGVGGAAHTRTERAYGRTNANHKCP